LSTYSFPAFAQGAIPAFSRLMRELNLSRHRILLSSRRVRIVLRKQLMETSSSSGLESSSKIGVPHVTGMEPKGGRRYDLRTVMILVLVIALAIVTLFSFAEFQSLQQISRVEQIGLSVVSGQVTASTRNLANVPYPSSIRFDPGFNSTLSAPILQEHYIIYLIDGLGYQVTIQFSNKTVCQQGTFAPKGAVVFRDFSC